MQTLPFEIQQFNPTDSSFHLDSIHHIEFDFYGKRVATVSSDKTVCIWDLDTETNSWKKSASWKRHGGSVWKVRFAHPEYGQVLATCSFDNTIQIYDKDAADVAEQSSRVGLHGAADTSNGWASRAVLRQSTTGVVDIQFAPNYLGLQLAACTATGRVIIYEAEDIMTLDNWNLVFDYEISSYRLSSLSWSVNRYTSPYIAVSSDDLNAPPNEKVYIFRVNINTGFLKPDIRNKDKFEFADQVNCLSFGPSAGLTYHKLAIAVGSKIYIYHLHVNTEENESIGSGKNYEIDFTTKLSGVLDEGVSLVVRISWNILGDMITAVYVDGIVRIWKYAFTNKWALLSAINPSAEIDRGNKDADIYY